MNKSQELNVDGRTPDNVEDLIKKSLASLKKQNLKSYEILIQMTEDGFFRKHQSKGNLDKFARQLIETISLTEK